MIRRYARRYQKWQDHVRLSTPFVILCGSVAILYFLYRIVLVLFPAMALEQAAFHPGLRPVVCNQDDSRLQDPVPILSANYQRRIHQQKPAGPNLVTNSKLSAVDEANQPDGYSHTVESERITYDLKNEAGTRFLHVANENKPLVGGIAPAWQMDQVPLEKDKAYAYSFWYRSSTPVRVLIEYQISKTRYTFITTLQSTTTWQQFAAHFDNIKGAKNLRVNLALTKPGQLDTRDFDIHKIPSAQLSKGIVSVTFDDGWQSISDKALSLLERHHVRTTQYIIGEIAGTTQEYMNFADLLQLKKKGHEIGSHSLTHCNQTELNSTELQQNAVRSKQILERQGFRIESFAYPLGQYDARTQAVYEQQYPFIRTSDVGYNDRYFDESNIRSVSADTATEAELQKAINYARDHRVWLVLTYHQVDAEGEYSVTSAQLEQQLEMIEDSDLDVLPLSEAARKVRE